MIRFIGYFLLFLFVFANAEARVVFLPDYGSDRVSFKRFEDGNANNDEPMCAQGGYHEAAGCPEPKIFDDFCPFDDDWISDCYCPSIFSEKCDGANEKGDIRQTDGNGYASCDDMWIECCETTCPEGTAVDNPVACGVGGKNGCGETCYNPYSVIPDDENCEYGVWVDGCDAGCGEKRDCCKTCEDNGGSRDCTGDRTTPCGDGEEEVSKCTNCYGKTIYTCETICVPKSSVEEKDCTYGLKEGGCDDGCGGKVACCAGCTPTLTAVEASTCDYGTKQVDNGCGTNVTQCKTCADNGGSSSCSGQTTACGENQTEKSSCTDCNGTKRYTCEDKKEETEVCSGNSQCVVGAIYYTDGTCCSDILESKKVAGVVVKDYEIIASHNGGKYGDSYQWGYDGKDVTDVLSFTFEELAKIDVLGAAHTTAIVKHFGANANQEKHAGVYCYNYAPEGFESSKNKWYLPAAGELFDYFYGGGTNYNKIESTWKKLGLDVYHIFVGGFWASTEYDAGYAWEVDVTKGFLGKKDKYSGSKITCYYRIGGTGNQCTSDCETGNSCPVGSFYYTDATCASCYNKCKSVAGIVVKDNALVMSLNGSALWGGWGVDVKDIPNKYKEADLKNDVNGKAYTAAFMKAHSSTNADSTYWGLAIPSCYYYEPMEGTKNKWYLPAVGELYKYVYGNYNTIISAYSKMGKTFDTGFNGNMISSSEYGENGIWVINPQTGKFAGGNDSKLYTFAKVCFLPIE